MKSPIVLAALLTAANALAQSARKQPEPGYIPGPPSTENSGPSSAYNPNTSQGLGQPGYGSDLPAGTSFGSSKSAAANSQAQPTTNEGQLYRADLHDNNVYPYRKTTPAIIGPQAPHKLPRVLVEPLPPDYNTPSPPPQGGTNIQRGAPQGANPATNASPQGLSPDKQTPTTGQPAKAGQMLQAPQ